MGNSPCGVATDHMVLTVNPGPTANAGLDATVCVGSAHTITGAAAYNYTSILWTTSGTGTLLGATSLTPTYTPAVGETSVTLTMTVYGFGGICNTSDAMVITYNAGQQRMPVWMAPHAKRWHLLSLQPRPAIILRYSGQPTERVRSLVLLSDTDLYTGRRRAWPGHPDPVSLRSWSVPGCYRCNDHHHSAESHSQCRKRCYDL